MRRRAPSLPASATLPPPAAQAKLGNQPPQEPKARTQPQQKDHTAPSMGDSLRAPNTPGRHQLTTTAVLRGHIPSTLVSQPLREQEGRPPDRSTLLQDLSRAPTQTTPHQGGQPPARAPHDTMMPSETPRLKRNMRDQLPE
ncbi:hypothetical protein CRENBAI_022694 [Crenichthys baileyi]|uniref:Uncharacterized protein n=1 Tax=Crenichthys baileyi TaxID=28760 RepID=A0AAV9QS77_9TELE